MSIPKGLILYRSQKYHQITLPVQTKHAIKSHCLDLSLFPPGTKKSSLILNKNKRFITRLIFPAIPKTKYSLKLALQTRSLKKLTFPIFYYLSRSTILHGLGRLLDRLFSKLKHLESLTIDSEAVVPVGKWQTWKPIMKLNSLTKLDMRLVYNKEFELEDDLRFFQRKNKQKCLPKLESQDFYFTLQSSPNAMFCSNPLRNNEGSSVKRNIKTPLALHLNLSSGNVISNIEVFNSWLLSFKTPEVNLVELEAKRFPQEHFSSILQLIKENKALKSLEIHLGKPLSSEDFLGLANSLPSLSSLKYLQVYISDLSTPSSIISPCFLIQQISKIPNLISLKIVFPGSLALTIDDFQTLSKTLLKLKTLQDFTLECPSDPYGYGENRNISFAIMDVIEALPINLQNLSLTLQGFACHLSDENIKTFGKYLHEFIHLKEFRLSLSSKRITAEGIRAFGDLLGGLKGLEILKIEVLQCGYFSEEVISEMIEKIDSMKSLRRLELAVRCKKLGGVFSGMLLRVTEGLRSLEYIGLKIPSCTFHGIHMLDAMRDLRKRMTVKWE